MRVSKDGLEETIKFYTVVAFTRHAGSLKNVGSRDCLKQGERKTYASKSDDSEHENMSKSIEERESDQKD